MSRDTFIEKMSALDYEFNAGVTRETNYLIVGADPGKTKVTKAERHNIPMITEAQFNNIINGG
jgi:NAD-dependent DNA ligase